MKLKLSALVQSREFFYSCILRSLLYLLEYADRIFF